jgi:hypothetical protein
MMATAKDKGRKLSMMNLLTLARTARQSMAMLSHRRRQAATRHSAKTTILSSLFPFASRTVCDAARAVGEVHKVCEQSKRTQLQPP